MSWWPGSILPKDGKTTFHSATEDPCAMVASLPHPNFPGEQVSPWQLPSNVDSGCSLVTGKFIYSPTRKHLRRDGSKYMQ